MSERDERWKAKVSKYCAENPDACENGHPIGTLEDELQLEFLSEELQKAEAEIVRLQKRVRRSIW